VSTPEASWKRTLVASFDKHFPKGWHTALLASAFGRAGLPDLRFAADGHAAWVEVKVHPFTLSKIQAWQLDRMASAGEVVYVCSLRQGPSGCEISLTRVRGPGAFDTWVYRTRHPHEALTKEFWVDLLRVRGQTPLGAPHV